MLGNAVASQVKVRNCSEKPKVGVNGSQVQHGVIALGVLKHGTEATFEAAKLTQRPHFFAKHIGPYGELLEYIRSTM